MPPNISSSFNARVLPRACGALLMLLCAIAALMPLKTEAAAAVTFLTRTDGGDTNETQYIFTNQTLGTAAADRIIFVTVHAEGANAADPSSVIVAGITATEVISVVDAGNGVLTSIYWAHVPTGTTGSVEVNTAGSTVLGVALFRATGIGTSIAASDTASDIDDMVSMSIDVPQGGILLAGASFINTGAITEVGIPEDHDATVTNSIRMTGGATGPLSQETNRTVSYDGDTGNAAGVTVSFAAEGGRLALVKPANNLGLVGYWSFNEGTGTIATDFSGNGNHGTLVNTPTWVNGKRGKALGFDDGSEESVSVSNFVIPTTDAGSVAFWMNPDDTFTQQRIFDSSDDFEIQITVGGEFANELYNASAAELIATSLPPMGVWTHVVMTYDDASNVQQIYINGVLDAQDTTVDSTPSGTVTLGIGARAGNSTTFGGKLDEVRVYNRVLGPTEIAALAKSGAVQIGASSRVLQNGTTLASGLVGHWTFDGTDVTDEVYDRSGSNNHGYFNGGATSSAKVIGKLGQALQFDGANDFVETNSAITYGTTVATVAFWLNWDSYADDCEPALASGDPDAANGTFKSLRMSAMLAGSLPW